MYRLFCVFALAAAGSLFASSAMAAVIPFHVTLDGAQAGVVTPASGSADLLLDDVADTLGINLVYADLLAPTTNAHIHCCAPPGINAGVIIPFIPAGFVTGTTSGSFAATIALTPALVADVASGLSYINIHTTLFPAGEIRGQIASVPEPAALSLLGLALAVAIALMGGSWGRSRRIAARGRFSGRLESGGHRPGSPGGR